MYVYHNVLLNCLLFRPFTDTKENVIVSFHPCTNVKIGNDTCGKGDGVSVWLNINLILKIDKFIYLVLTPACIYISYAIFTIFI